MDENERMRAKLTAIHNMLPRLREHLPGELAGELAAHLYVLPFEPATAADIARGQQLAAELARATTPAAALAGTTTEGESRGPVPLPDPNVLPHTDGWAFRDVAPIRTATEGESGAWT